MTRFSALALAAFGLAAPAGAGAQAQPVPTFPARAERVVVDVVVTDRDGVPVTGLSAADFEVSEDGERQRIASFEAVAPRPARETGAGEGAGEPPPAPAAAPPPGLFYVVAFDDLNLTPFTVHKAKAAVAAFLRSLAEDDRVLLVSTSTGEGGFAESDAGRRELVGMLRRLKAGHLPDLSPDGMSDYEAMMIHVHRDPETEARVARRIAARARAGSLSVPALAAETYGRAAGRIRGTLRALQQVLMGLIREKGRKSVILVSEGFVQDPWAEESRNVTHVAMRANAALYFVDARGLDLGSAEYPAELNDLGIPGDLAITLAEEASATFGSEGLAEDTGGFSVRNTNDLERGVRRIADESRAYYLLGYDPTKEPDRRFRKIRVKVHRKGVRVRARKGYYADSRPAAAAP